MSGRRRETEDAAEARTVETSADPQAADVAALHAEIDARVRPLAERHRARLRCGLGCNACCIDDLTVFEVEAARIVAGHASLLREGLPHPPGACAFLGEAGECRIYDARPQVCRTQGLPLRWLAEDASGEIVERRSICELNAAGAPLDALAEDDCWQLGPFEERLIRLQAERDGVGERRIGLRSLFARGPSGG